MVFEDKNGFSEARFTNGDRSETSPANDRFPASCWHHLNHRKHSPQSAKQRGPDRASCVVHAAWKLWKVSRRATATARANTCKHGVRIGLLLAEQAPATWFARPRVARHWLQDMRPFPRRDLGARSRRHTLSRPSGCRGDGRSRRLCPCGEYVSCRSAYHRALL